MPQPEALGTMVREAVTWLDGWQAGDAAAVVNLHRVMQDIQGALAQVDQTAAQWVARIEGTMFEANLGLQQLIAEESQDVDKTKLLIEQLISTLRIECTDDMGGEGLNVSAPEATTRMSSDVAEELVIPDDDVPLILDFISESGEHIEVAEAALLELEKDPRDQEVINRIFRSFHTIKGMAGFLNLGDFAELAHAAENLLSKARKGELTLQGMEMDAIFASGDMMKKMISLLKGCLSSGKPFPKQACLAPLLSQLKDCLEGVCTPKLPEDQPNEEQDRQLDAVLETEPSQPQVKYERAKSMAADDKIKVSISRLDSMIDMAGELVIANLMVSEEVKEKLTSEHELACKVSHLGKIVREVQELSMAMRMVPIQGVFQKMTRLVRDLARKSNKDIKLITQGEDTELDRTVVDKIADPLVHMIRNSVDHGVETPEERQQAGKDSVGTIHLRAFHQAGSIVIEIEDDGRGLNKDRILKKAVENGVVEPGQDLSDEEVYKLIFHAGLSTAAQVTDISGRGVGMDVVRKNIEALRGKVDIRSTPGQGTIFTIRMPLTLAIIDGQIVRIGREHYIIPTNSIVQSLRPTRQQLSTVQDKAEMIVVRGSLVPLVRLDGLFGITSDTKNLMQSLVVVVEDEGCQCCLVVDDLLGQQQVVIKSLGKALGSVPGVSGGAIMGNGKVSLILDVPGLIELSHRT